MPLSAVLLPGVYIDQVGLRVLLGKKKKKIMSSSAQDGILSFQNIPI